jgi:hypothetical protein
LVPRREANHVGTRRSSSKDGKGPFCGVICLVGAKKENDGYVCVGVNPPHVSLRQREGGVYLQPKERVLRWNCFVLLTVIHMNFRVQNSVTLLPSVPPKARGGERRGGGGGLSPRSCGWHGVDSGGF